MCARHQACPGCCGRGLYVWGGPVRICVGGASEVSRRMVCVIRQCVCPKQQGLQLLPDSIYLLTSPA